MNSVREQCPCTMTQTVHCFKSVVCVVHAHCVCSHAHVGCSVAMRWALYHHALGTPLSRHRPQSRPCHHTKQPNPIATEKNSVAIDFSFTLKCRCRDTKLTHKQHPVATPKYCRDTKIPSYPKPVAT